MSKIKVGINGFGRIGRNVYKAAFDHPEIEIVVVNDLTDSKTLAHLLKYDSVFGPWNKEIHVEGDSIKVDGRTLKVSSCSDLEKLMWKDYGVDIVVESTGIFTDAVKARKHIDFGGAKKVLISAPAKNEDITICMGVNDDKYEKNKHAIVSNASCTTNCLAPVAKALHSAFVIKRGLMTTIHSFTNDQRILDLPHSDLRRARAASVSMIPTTTGAAKAVGLVLPELKGKLDGMAIRVPTPNVSVIDLVVETEKSTTKEEVNKVLKDSALGKLKGILAFSEDELVSRDFLGDAHSSIVDGLCTAVMQGNMIKVISWYDNEWGYSNRVVDAVMLLAK
ncbi:MAG: type I glyceraldehyde-3-phosphate dehydrogenase [Spirochaetia bacterium]|nr:type I glyceraldehyde-3-phosphate dehydrogenase [Spirochaetia bacterium]